MRYPIYNLTFDNLTLEESLGKISNLIMEERKSLVVSPNMSFFWIARKNATFQQIIMESDLSLLDGRPILWLGRLYGYKFKEQICGSDLGPRLIQYSAEKNYRIMIFGGSMDATQKAKMNVDSLYKNVAFEAFSPPLGFESDSKQLEDAITFIRDFKPHIVIMCLGAPKQELFYENNFDKLPTAVYLGLGATVNFIAGTSKRAPKWMTRLGLEWLYRLLKEPKRLFLRYLRCFAIIPRIICYRIFKFRKHKQGGSVT